MKVPSHLKYTKDHEWANLTDGVLTVGITDFAQNSLGDIVFVELPETGTKLNQEQAFGVVESIKSVSDLYSPLAGEVLEVNSELENSPELINQNPYEAWFIKIKLNSDSDFNNMLSSDDYEKRCQEEI